MKKVYRKPTLRSQKLQLGVFGNYGQGGGGGGGDDPTPVKIIDRFELHMD